MPLSPEERADISRANGNRSKGPTSESGKLRSRRNALKHGLRAETVPLPNEDPAAIAARAAAWADYYQPDSPAAHHLVNQCVRATLLADRCHMAHDAAVADQIDAAAPRWERDRQEQVQAFRLQLATDPAAVAGLERTGHGCRWLIGCWEELARSLEANGCWSPRYGEYAIRLLGCRPDPETLRHNTWAYLVFLFHLRCQPEPPEEVIAILSQPDHQPVDVRTWEPGEWSPELRVCRNWMRKTRQGNPVSVQILTFLGRVTFVLSSRPGGLPGPSTRSLEDETKATPPPRCGGSEVQSLCGWSPEGASAAPSGGR